MAERAEESTPGISFSESALTTNEIPPYTNGICSYSTYRAGTAPSVRPATGGGFGDSTDDPLAALVEGEQQAPERIFVRKKLLRERLVDDDDAAAAFAIGDVEIPTAQNGKPSVVK